MGVLRVLTNLVFAGVFALGAYVQQNDPDPERWIAVYSVPCAIALLSILRVPKLEFLSLIVGIIAVVWAGQLWPVVIEQYQKVGSVSCLVFIGKEFETLYSTGYDEICMKYISIDENVVSRQKS